MPASDLPELPWTEAASRDFIERGQVYTPHRDEIRDAILDLIPARADEGFLAVELGVGGGWLSEAILERFPASRVLGLDASPTMLDATASRLARFAGRFTLRPFRLEDRSWLAELAPGVLCFVSVLVVHHLDGAGKRALYRDLHDRLEPGGGVLIADLVAPGSDRARRHMARAWDAVVERQSLALTGSPEAHRRFVAERWNWYEYPDPMDMPSTLPEHLAWLAEVGFVGADVFWAQAGHALYGGYKAAPR